MWKSAGGLSFHAVSSLLQSSEKLWPPRTRCFYDNSAIRWGSLSIRASLNAASPCVALVALCRPLARRNLQERFSPICQTHSN